MNQLKQWFYKQIKTVLIKMLLNQALHQTSREEYIKNVTIALMSTPEYQLC